MNMCKQPPEKNLSSIPFFSCSTCNSVFPFLFTCHTSWICSVTASSASTFYSCKWMITLPSHLRRTSSGKALLSLHRECCSEAVPEWFFLSFLSLLRNCFDWMICSEVSSGVGLGLVWPSSGSTRNNFLWIFSSLQISSGLGKDLSILAN